MATIMSSAGDVAFAVQATWFLLKVLAAAVGSFAGLCLVIATIYRSRSWASNVFASRRTRR